MHKRKKMKKMRKTQSSGKSEGEGIWVWEATIRHKPHNRGCSLPNHSLLHNYKSAIGQLLTKSVVHIIILEIYRAILMVKRENCKILKPSSYQVRLGDHFIFYFRILSLILNLWNCFGQNNRLKERSIQHNHSLHRNPTNSTEI